MKVIRAGEDDQGGGRNHMSRERESETRGEVNTIKDREKTITWKGS